VLSLLLVLKRQDVKLANLKPSDAKTSAKPSLQVAPALLLGNWASEIMRFAPSLKVLLAHPSALSASDLKALDAGRLAQFDLVITSYGSLLRLPCLKNTPWRLVVIDEAQAIKNPFAKQTRATQQLSAQARIALAGTPIENRLGDLWSIFDFINPGLLGLGRIHHAPRTPQPDHRACGGAGLQWVELSRACGKPQPSRCLRMFVRLSSTYEVLRSSGSRSTAGPRGWPTSDTESSAKLPCLNRLRPV